MAEPALPDLAALRFEELVELLERLTARLANGDIGIEEAADLYDAAQRVHAAAAERLAAVQARIESLGALSPPDGATGPTPG